MGKGFKHGAGGLPLNFKIVGGTVQPSFHMENTLWVNTADTITGWVCSPVQPKGTAGLLWIKTGSEGTGINILRRNAIELYPAGVQQYSGGSWQERQAKLYVGGQWVDVIRYRYLSLNAADWVANRLGGNGGSVASAGNSLLVKTGEYYTAGMTYVPKVSAVLKQETDLRGCATMEVEIALSKTGLQLVQLCVMDGPGESAQVLASVNIPQSTGKTVCSLDVSSLSTGYPAIQIHDNTELTTATVTMLRMKGAGA